MVNEVIKLDTHVCMDLADALVDGNRPGIVVVVVVVRSFPLLAGAVLAGRGAGQVRVVDECLEMPGVAWAERHV